MMASVDFFSAEKPKKMGILVRGPKPRGTAQHSHGFRLRRQQFQGAYGASRHTAPHATSVAGISNGSADGGHGGH